MFKARLLMKPGPLRTGLFAVLVAAASAASAAEVSGVKLDDQLNVNGTSLLLNGAGLRTEYFVSVYVAALYVPQKSGDADTLISEKQPRRILMVMKRDVGAAKMLAAFHRGIEANLSAAEQAELKPRLDEYDRMIIALKEVKAGDRITQDFDADGGVVLALDGQTQTRVAGPDMASALLKIWLGANPAQDDLKKALLGQ